MPVKLQIAWASMALRGRLARRAANDNLPASAEEDFGRRLLLREALRHLTAHGAGAAEMARGNAEQAFFAGRRRDYLHWLAICRALDRRLAEAAQPRRQPAAVAAHGKPRS